MSVLLQVTQSSRFQAVHMQGWLVVLLLAGSIIGTESLTRGDFFPFGATTEDLTILSNDDDTGLRHCSSVPHTFMGIQRSCFYVSNNGIITFTRRQGTYLSDAFPLSTNFQTIAAFSGDVDTRATGQVWYREATSDTSLMRMVDNIIHQEFPDEGRFASRSVTVVTWDEVGYYREMSDFMNTFQCVMASDGQNLFVIFLYADIQWINSAGNPASQVGFDAGNGVNYYELPWSKTDEVGNLAIDSNVGVPGKWAFKVSGPTILSSGGCPVPIVSSGNIPTPACTIPSYGNQLGGDLITIWGPYFSDVGDVQCNFGGTTHAALHESGRVHCAVPVLNRNGRVSLQLLLNEEVEVEVDYTALSIETAYRVDVTPSPSSSSFSLPLILTSNSMATITWNPEHIFPQVDIQLEAYSVDVLLYIFNIESSQWVEHLTLSNNIRNSGSVTVTIPSGISNDMVPIAIKVATSLDPSTTFDGDSIYRKLFRARQRVGIWSSEYYYINPGLRTGGRRLCQDWNQQEGTSVAMSLVADSTPCAPTLSRARLVTSGLSEIMLRSVYGNSQFAEQWINTFHSGSTHCFRQTTLDSMSQREQECCYDISGNLVNGSPTGGAIKRFSKKMSLAMHFTEDIRPFLLCCASLAPICALYYAQRPSDDGSRFNAPTPAWIFGDPHMITLDHIFYTFNGYGEFTLLTTTHPQFTLQGRMAPLQDTPQGTVCTAIAARVGAEGTRVMIAAGANSAEVYVNDLPLNQREFTQGSVAFDTFSISLKNNTASLQFVNGVYLECKVSQGFITRVVIAVPTLTTFVNTKGLLGVFNGIPEDDLTPAGSNAVPVPFNSDLRTIHQQFGVTWMIDDESESLFTYFPYTTFSNFSNSSYLPLFNYVPSENIANRCEGESFCEFDFTVTGSASFAQATLSVIREERSIAQLAAPVTCEPPCSNGVCIPGNECFCPQGFSGLLCETAEVEECGGLINPCDSSSERCSIQAGSYYCVLDCIRNPDSERCRNPTTAPPPASTVSTSSKGSTGSTASTTASTASTAFSSTASTASASGSTSTTKASTGSSDSTLSTNAVMTIIIAAAAGGVVGGTLLITCLIITCVVLCVACGKKKGSDKDPSSDDSSTNGHYRKTVVGSSSTILPTCSDLEDDGYEMDNRHYENMRYPLPPIRETRELATRYRLPPLHRVQELTYDSEEDEVPWYRSTQSMRSQDYHASPSTPNFPRSPSAPLASHQSLQQRSFNPAGGTLRSHSSMGQQFGNSMSQGMKSRSSASMGWNSQNRYSNSRGMQKVRSIPVDIHMDYYTDV